MIHIRERYAQSRSICIDNIVVVVGGVPPHFQLKITLDAIFYFISCCYTHSGSKTFLDCKISEIITEMERSIPLNIPPGTLSCMT